MFLSSFRTQPTFHPAGFFFHCAPSVPRITPNFISLHSRLPKTGGVGLCTYDPWHQGLLLSLISPALRFPKFTLTRGMTEIRSTSTRSHTRLPVKRRILSGRGTCPLSRHSCSQICWRLDQSEGTQGGAPLPSPREGRFMSM